MFEEIKLAVSLSKHKNKWVFEGPAVSGGGNLGDEVVLLQSEWQEVSHQHSQGATRNAKNVNQII